MANRAEQRTPEHRGPHYIDIHEVPPVPQEQIRLLTADNDQETLFHQKSVGALAEMIARHQGLSNLHRIHAQQTGEEHDCGKSDWRVRPFLRADNRSNANPISSEEARKAIKPHARYGAEMARKLGFPKLHVVTIRTHHNSRVHYEGFKGLTLLELAEIYGPDYLQNTEILQTADSFHSGIVPHHDKPAKSPEVMYYEILEMMKSGRYNPKLEKAFRSMYEEVTEEKPELLTTAA